MSTNHSKRNLVKKKQQKAFRYIEESLSVIDAEMALEYYDWLEKKTKYLKESYFHLSYGSQPDHLSRGDIVWVEFGINVGTELSDVHTKGHFAVVWCVDLGNLVVIPLSSRDAPGSALTFDLGVIEGLNEEDNEQHSFLKLDAIRSISKRRIARMNGKKGGKLTLLPEKIHLIEQAIRQSFLE